VFSTKPSVQPRWAKTQVTDDPPDGAAEQPADQPAEQPADQPADQLLGTPPATPETSANCLQKTGVVV
jgi:hypothetical protein